MVVVKLYIRISFGVGLLSATPMSGLNTRTRYMQQPIRKVTMMKERDPLLDSLTPSTESEQFLSIRRLAAVSPCVSKNSFLISASLTYSSVRRSCVLPSAGRLKYSAGITCRPSTLR